MLTEDERPPLTPEEEAEEKERLRKLAVLEGELAEKKAELDGLLQKPMDKQTALERARDTRDKWKSFGRMPGEWVWSMAEAYKQAVKDEKAKALEVMEGIVSHINKNFYGNPTTEGIMQMVRFAIKAYRGK